MLKKYNFVYSAWPYPNGDLHLGRIIGSILPADILYKYLKKFKNKEYTVYTFGSDSHGTPIIIQAANEKCTEEQILDKYHNKFINTMSSLQIKPTLYNHTHTQYHFKKVSELLKIINHKKIKEKYGIYYKTIKIFYCNFCKKELESRLATYNCKCGHITDREQCDKCWNSTTFENIIFATCKICLNKANIIEKEVEVLNISEYKDVILKYISEEYPDFYKLSVSYFDQSECDKEISRNLKWGVPSIFINRGVIYVWFEALLGYITNSYLFLNNLEKINDFYFIGLDNWMFHIIILSVLKLSLNLKLPKKIFIRHYLTFENEKMSGSKKNYKTVEELLDLNYSSDAIRWYLCKIDPYNSDSNFSENDLKKSYNTEVIDIIVNFQHRLFGLIKKYNIKHTYVFKNYYKNINAFYLKTDLKKISNEILKNYKILNNKLQLNEFQKNYIEIFSKNIELLEYLEPIMPEISIKFLNILKNDKLIAVDITSDFLFKYKYPHL